MKKAMLLIAFIGLLFASATACGNDDANGNGNGTGGEVVHAAVEFEPFPDDHPLVGANAILSRFPMQVDNGLPHLQGTTFRYMLSSTQSLPGNFGAATFGDAAIDGIISTLLGTENSIFSMTPMMTWGQDGIARFEYDIATYTITIHMQEYVYWHDGTPLTLDDLVYTFEVIADEDYPGVRFSVNEQNVVGIMEFRYGQADHISGMQLFNNNRSLSITLTSFPPEILYFGLWSSPMPRHIFGHLAVADIRASNEFLLNMGWGPFMYMNSIPGEQVLMERNPNYVWGVPYIEWFVVDVVHPELVAAHMIAGQYDFASFPSHLFEDHQSPVNFRYVSAMGNNYNYLSFRLGEFDWGTNEAVFDPTRLMNNVYLRRAMAHAIDFQELGDMLFSGLQFPAGNVMSPMHYGFMDTSVPVFRYNPALANQILDQAGFVMGADGFRTNTDGSELTINWLYATSPVEDIFVPYVIQSFERIGLRVELWGGRPLDGNYVWDVLDYSLYLGPEYDQDVHIYMASWTAGANPNPAGRWGNAFWNPSLYNSEEWQAILSRLSSMAAWDQAYLLDAYSAMQWYVYENVFYFPTLWGVTLHAINNRVANWDNRVGIPPQESGWHLIRLTSVHPYSN
jgi:peptide/nickel transport system substrate-binding protein